MLDFAKGRAARGLIRMLGAAIATRAAQHRGLCVINYHRILEADDPLLESEPDVATFRWQMELLAECFNVLPLRAAIDLLGTARMPARAVCITFDDGYRSVHDLALPILTELKLPATVFVTSAFLHGGSMWNDRIIEATQSLAPGQLDLRDLDLGVYSLASLGQRQQAVKELTEVTKYLPPQARLALINRLGVLVSQGRGRGQGQDHDHDHDRNLMLTPAMMLKLDRSGIEIGAHTITHPILTNLSDESAVQEIAGGKHALEAILGKPVQLFAYPNGKAGKDFDQRHTRMAQQAGFLAAFTTATGAIRPGQNRFELPRSRPWDNTPFLFGLRLLRWLIRDQLRPSSTNELEQKNTSTGKAEMAFTEQANANAYPATRPGKRVLLTAFHFPPQAASSGMQRTLSFSRHLCRNGWEPMVLTAHARAYYEQNTSKLCTIPSDLIVRRTFALDAKRHLGIKGRYLEAMALPDRWVSWWFAGVAGGMSLIWQYKPQVIWSTFPIATSHLIALALHRITGLPWVADFRDPMLQPSYPNSKAQRAAFAWIERQTITRCSAAVFTTYSARDSYLARFPQLTPEKSVVIENGYDEDGFCDAVPLAPAVPVPGRCLTLLHSGMLYDKGRDPSPFLAALAALRDAGKFNAQSLQVVLRAPGDVAAVRALVARYNVGDMVKVEPSVSYCEALAEMLGADGLIVFQGTPFNTQIPAKIYEYFRARKPILALVDDAGETARVLRMAGFDAIADMTSSAAIMAVLERLLGQIRAGQASIASEELIASSARNHRASQLAQVLDRVMDEQRNKPRKEQLRR